MTKTMIPWSLAFGLLLPGAAQAQQDPMLIGEGAQVYSANCARCHNARSSTERSDAEWATIVLHMRARANLTKGQARAVLVYLQATNTPEATPAVGDRETALSDTNVVMPNELRTALLARRLSAKTGRAGRNGDPGGFRPW